MSLLAVDIALQKRLRGDPLDSQGRSIAKRGIRVPNITNRESTSATSQFGTFEPKFDGTYRQVPIYRYKDDGEYWDIYPRIVFRRIGFEHDAQQSPFEPDKKIGTAGNDVTVYDQFGNVVGTGKEFNVMQRVPESYTHRYQLDLWAESAVERDLLLEAVLKEFKPEGFLEYVQRDNSTVVVDMILEDTSPDVMEPTGEIEERQAVQVSLTYRVEAFEDTSDTVYQVPAITDVGIVVTHADAPPAQEGIRERQITLLRKA